MLEHGGARARGRSRTGALERDSAGRGSAGRRSAGSRGRRSAGTPGAPDRGGAGAPDRGGAGAPDRGGARAPDRGGARAPDRGGAGAPDRGGARAPWHRGAGSQDRRGAGVGSWSVMDAEPATRHRDAGRVAAAARGACRTRVWARERRRVGSSCTARAGTRRVGWSPGPAGGPNGQDRERARHRTLDDPREPTPNPRRPARGRHRTLCDPARGRHQALDDPREPDIESSTTRERPTTSPVRPARSREHWPSALVARHEATPAFRPRGPPGSRNRPSPTT